MDLYKVIYKDRRNLMEIQLWLKAESKEEAIANGLDAEHYQLLSIQGKYL
jgi:hypothetical protein